MGMKERSPITTPLEEDHGRLLTLLVREKPSAAPCPPPTAVPTTPEQEQPNLSRPIAELSKKQDEDYDAYRRRERASLVERLAHHWERLDIPAAERKDLSRSHIGLPLAMLAEA
ncbi:uncharacterized protein LOC144161758 [Haemaphysalis longicornis]